MWWRTGPHVISDNTVLELSDKAYKTDKLDEKGIEMYRNIRNSIIVFVVVIVAVSLGLFIGRFYTSNKISVSNKKFDKYIENTINSTEEITKEVSYTQESTWTNIKTPTASTEKPVNKLVNGGNYVRLSDYVGSIIINDINGYTKNSILNTLSKKDMPTDKAVYVSDVHYDTVDEETYLNVIISHGYGETRDIIPIPYVNDESEQWKSTYLGKRNILYVVDIGYVNEAE